MKFTEQGSVHVSLTCEPSAAPPGANDLGLHFAVRDTGIGIPLEKQKHIFEAFSNVQPVAAFRASLARYFTIEKCFPTSYNWHGGQPAKALLQAANMNVKANIPVIGPKLAVEYFFICSPR